MSLDKVKYKTVNATTGASNINTGGLKFQQILGVWRKGLNYDYVSLLGISTADRGWAYIGLKKRIVFSPLFPFTEGEKIFILYKVTI